MSPSSGPAPLTIRRLQGESEARACATIMSTSEPWITLRRTFDIALTRVAESERETWVALDDGGVAGFAILSMRGPFAGYVQTLAVRADRRSEGVGTRLLRFAEERILRQVPNVFLCVSSFNPRARALYERLGYECVGDLRDYIVRGHAEILMRKSASPIAEFSTQAGDGEAPAGPLETTNGETLVHRYYDELWNRWQDDLVDELLAPDFAFRGSLGETMRGRDAFRRYRDKVRAAFPDFTNTVVEIASTGTQVAARLEYRGTHGGPLFGVAPTGRRIAYSGAAFFRLAGAVLAEGWVLGDTESLRAQLTGS